MRLDAVRTALAGRLSADGEQWLRQSVGRIEASAPAIRSLFPAAGRRCGRGPLDASLPTDPETLRGWTVDAAARVVLLGALPLAGPALAEEIAQLYRYGDAAEKQAVLRGLALLDASHGLGEAGLPIVRDALRTNDTRLVAAALGPYGAKHLDAPAYRQGVLKCVFMGIPLADISGLDRRSDDELARMLQAFAEERIAAGRPVPADVWLIVPRTPDLEPTED
jgi:hypothetical protein